MNYLELVQTTLGLLRAGNERLSEPPTTLDGLSGIGYEVAQWVRLADRDIQNSRVGWLFLQRSGEITLPPGQRVVDVRAALTDVEAIIPSAGDGDGRFVTTAGDDPEAEIKCHYVPWAQWRGSVFDRAPRADGAVPVRFTVQPDGRLVFDPAPAAARRLLFEYRARHVPMADDASESLLPAKHRMAIVFWAIARYYCLTRDKTGEFRAKAGAELERELTRLYNEQLPEVTYGAGAP